MNKNPKNVAAGKKASAVRWATRHALIDELRKIYGNDKKTMDWFQFVWKTDQLAELVKHIHDSKMPEV